MIHRQGISIGARIWSLRIVPAHRESFHSRYRLNAGRRLHFIHQTTGKASTRSGVGISPVRQTDPCGPNMVRTKSRFLIAQANETRSEHCRRGKQHHRESNLGSNQSPAKSMLAASSTDGADAFFQSLNEISSRTLPCWITSHGQPSQQ